MAQTAANHCVSIETKTHTIEVSEGGLTIGEHTPSETQAVLDIRLSAQSGAKPVRLSIGCSSGGKTFPSLRPFFD